MKNKTGFTLIELMVVIGIIGILTTIVYANFSDARKVARDDIRKTDLKSLQLAINLYKAQNGFYPAACNGTADYSGGKSGVYACAPGVDYILGLVPDYLPEMPYDPGNSNPNAGYLYRVNAAGTEYKLLVNGTVESLFITSYNDEYARCPQMMTSGVVCLGAVPPNATYAVYTSGASGW